MRKLLLLIVVLLAWTVSGQNNGEYVVFENVIITPNPAKMGDFKKHMADHNKKYHADDVYGCRVYAIVTGPNTGKYVWSMGPIPWSSVDSRPAQGGHDEHWNNMVMPTLLPMANATYWRSHPELSNFPNDFKLDKLRLTYYDIKRGWGNFDKIKAIVAKITKMNKEKYPNEVYGIYTNEFGSTKEGKDIVFVDFFENSAKLGEQDDNWISNYDEVNGAGSFERDVKTWHELTNGSERELWILAPELSGRTAEVKVN
ncbi:hypothetical protein SAMN04487906_2936 [Zhouia amylolytica]|uniref:Uncharacterized protein n=2 Tax=Zhouia amylolytica TaxID=376730 RepID=W2USU3_9FLAO|nr:hypothetical protein [Zhouia amylolytica]ETN96551.1 hypothetical protein P278_06290 [Zhouia amylolytica AD3]MCQ0109962.1 hypothetical protein [Zhouia amylolytica]SFT09828.1 hypothetical protein SAMN04487906_2936 [Zhouia amylolytica]